MEDSCRSLVLNISVHIFGLVSKTPTEDSCVILKFCS